MLLPDDPGRLLAALGLPRGGWERGEGWGVHSGSAATVESGPEEGDRFSAIRRRSEAWTGSPAGSGPDRNGGRSRDDLPLPRLYGGFSFHASPEVSGAWSAFPSARFRVPSREVRREGGDAWLLATRAEGDGAGEDAHEGAFHELERLEDRIRTLAAESGRESGGPVRISADVEAQIGELTDDGGPAGPGAERLRWQRGVEAALAEMAEGRLEKVVLARTLDAAGGAAVSPVRAFRRLRADNPSSSLFFLQPAPDTAFLGASPELLGAARGYGFRATAVAGSVPRGGSEEEDRSLGRRLLESEKDRREQAIVAEEIRRCLSSRLRAVSVGAPRLLKLARIQHLESSVEGRFPHGDGPGRGDDHLLDLIAELHPTPAVCGRPRARALETLRRSEPFARGWYAGPVGWFDPSGRGEFVPGLRSAVLHGGAWRLFAGAGIVEGSDPEREWKETSVKFIPMLRALGVGVGT